MFFDIIVKNGFVVDGGGNPWFRADVGVRGGRISGIGRLRKVGSSHGSRIPQISGHHIAERTPYHITKKGKTIANIEVERTVDCSFFALFFTYPLPSTFFCHAFHQTASAIARFRRQPTQTHPLPLQFSTHLP